MTERYEPVFFVRVKPEEGGDERVDLTGQVLTFSYEDNERAADKLSLTIDNSDLANFEDPVWKKGNMIEVSWGYPDAMAPIRSLQIVKVTGFLTLSVEAHGKEVLANKVVKNRIFENKTRSAVAEEIAAELGYSGEDVVHIQDTEVVYETIAQAGLTDAQFLRRLAHKESFEWYVDWDGFHFHERDVAQDAIKTYVYYNINERQGEIIDIEIENDVTAKPGKVKVKGRDPENRKDVDEEADNNSDNKRGVLAELVELIDPETGKSLGLSKVGQETTQASSEESDAAAKRQAAGRFRKVQQVAVKIKLTVEGDPSIVAKSVFKLENVGKRLSQKYYIRKVVHTITTGYTMLIEGISDGSGGHSTKSKRASGLSGIQVGPSANGKRAKKEEDDKQKVDGPADLATVEKIDPETGKTVKSFQDNKKRRKPRSDDYAR